MLLCGFFMLAGNVLWSLGMCCPVWSHCNRRGSRPRGEAFAPARSAHHSPRGRASYRAVCIVCFVGGPPRGEALAPARPAHHSPRGRASYGWVHICLCGRPDSGRSSCSCQARTPFAARARLLRAGMHICLCGRPALGAKLLLLKTSRSAQAGTHVGWALAHHTQRYA